MRRTLIGAMLGALLLALAAPSPGLAAAGPSVWIQVEGENQTLLPRTRVTTSTDPVPVNNCSGTSVAGAIEVATKGNWDRQQFASTILGETHNFTHQDYWAEWLNYRYGNGICNDQLSQNDEIVMLVDVSDSNFAPTVFPMTLRGVPSSAGVGESFTVTVTDYRSDGTPGQGTPTPVAGATVSGGGVSATTGTDGRAQLSLPAAGDQAVRATKGRERSAAAAVCVHAGNDGRCGTASGSAQAGATAPGAEPAPGSTPPATPLRARNLGLLVGHRYPVGTAPRTLRGNVFTGGAALRSLRLRLRRYDRGHCSFYSLRFERFHPARCVLSYFYYPLPARAPWSYLLPEALAPGFYTLETEAVDVFGRLSRARTVFFVTGRAR